MKALIKCGCLKHTDIRECEHSAYINSTYLYYYYPLEGDRLIVPSGCNTAAPELHLRPAVAKSPSTLDAFPGSAHPTPLAKINASPPTNFHHPPDDFRNVCFFPIYLYFIATLSFIMSWFC